ncbi:MAG: transposase zinc-binding domain-containing protein [Terrisporobacter sp.]
MNRYKNNKNDRKLEKILVNHFEEFKKIKLSQLRNKEMRKHIVDTVEKALKCGDIKYGYAKHKCLTCDEEYIHLLQI